MLAKQLQGAAKFAVPQYIEDVFSTWLYTGNGSTQTITNGIDLSGKGGLVWIKKRSSATGGSNLLLDTLRGGNKWISSNSTNGESTSSQVTFGSSGFDAVGPVDNAATYASWTFRKQAKFFDVVTYTGNGASNRGIPHNLGSTPGFILVKATSTTGDWYALHRVGNSGSWGVGTLNSTGTFSAPSPSFWGNGTTFTAPTSTTFTVSADGGGLTNGSGVSFVAYLFAHNAGGFGAAGTDNVISCGSYTGNGSTTGPTVTLNYEPQWIMIKRTDTAGTDWWMFDNMRGLTMGADADLRANLTQAEEAVVNNINPTATGFSLQSTTAAVNASGGTYIYIAIRRGPMKTPTSGTSVFTPTKVTGSSVNQTYSVGFPADLFIGKDTLSDTYTSWVWQTRFTKDAAMSSNSTSAENIAAWGNDGVKWDRQNSIFIESTGYLDNSPILYTFRRAPGFFDVVCYSGDSTFGRQVTHNLGVTPEMFIVKARNAAQDWVVYHKDAGATNKIVLNTTAARVASTMFNNTAPSATAFVVGASGNLGEVNFSTYNYVAYLFATVTGVSKVGSYTGNGTSQTVACGFTAGARFILIKRIDPGSTGDWYVWDTARGIVSGNDPHLSLNTTSAEVTTNDTIDPDNSGFIVNQVAATNVNVNNAIYIFLAIA